MVLTTPAFAQEERLGADVPSLLTWIEQSHPELRSMRAEEQAARERVIPAGALPDPMVLVELRDIPVRDPSFLPNEVGSTRYQIRQTIPLGGMREARRAVAEAEVRGAGARREATRAELAWRAKTAYGQYAYAEEGTRVTHELKRLVDNVERLARVRFEAGLATSQDVIKAQAERTLVDNDLIMLDTERHHATARLNAVLGRAHDAPLAPPAGPRPVPVSALDINALQGLMRTANPRLLGETARIEAARRTERLTRANRWWPDLTVGVAPIQREDRVRDWELMFEVNLPLQRGTRYAQEREAAAMLVAAQSRRQALELDLTGELAQSWAALRAAVRQEALLDKTLLPQAQLTFESALAGYQTGRVDFATLLDAQRQIRRTRLDILKLKLEQQIRLAEIERVIGEEL